MGEVASNILHNVGNVLNSINVSVGLLSQYLQEMPIADVGRVAHLLEDHQDDVGEFLTCHPKGKRIPSFLTQLGGHLALHFDSAKNELETLMPQLERVNEILATQKVFAAANAVLEPVVLASLIEQALLINQPGLEKYHIAVKLKLSDVPKIVVDRYQVFQILINLIRNAKEAMQVQGGAPHRLTVELTRPADHHEVVRIQVSDTGIGISPEHLTRIFAPKFTSSNQRQGLGLHGSALAAKNMGGALRAWSAGEGHGATFTLDLPMRTFEDSPSPTESLPTLPHTE